MRSGEQGRHVMIATRPLRVVRLKRQGMERRLARRSVHRSNREGAMRWAKTARFLGRCIELVLRRDRDSTEAKVLLSKEPAWDQLSDCEKHARLRERS